MNTKNIHVERIDWDRFMLLPLSTANNTSVKWFHDETCRILSDEATCTCTKAVVDEP